MNEIRQTLRQKTAAMEGLLRDGRVDDFLRLAEQRHTLLRQLSEDARRDSATDGLLREMREQTELWLGYIRQTSAELKNKINQTNKKRSSLAHLAGAYAGTHHAGTLVFRRG